jgi:hypothetical protein
MYSCGRIDLLVGKVLTNLLNDYNYNQLGDNGDRDH